MAGYPEASPFYEMLRNLKKSSPHQALIKEVVFPNYQRPVATTRFFFLFLISTAASVTQVRSQIQAHSSIANEIWFDQITGTENSGIINGPEYKMYVLGASSHPFFGSGEIKGSVRYNGDVFFVPLLYDIYQDEIVVSHLGASGRGWLIQLDKNFVQEFVISDRLFRNFDRGFHEVLFESDDFLLVSRRSKDVYSRKGIFNYTETNRFMVIASDGWKPIRNRMSFLKMLPGKADKKQFRIFLDRHNIKVRKFRNEELVKAATFIHALRNNKQ